MEEMKATPEEVEKAMEGLTASLARSYGMDQREVLELMLRKHGGTKMDLNKSEKVLGNIEGQVGKDKDPMNRMVDMDVMDELRERREERKKERSRRNQEDDGVKGSSSSGFDMDKMMQFMMMKAMMKEMGDGGGKNDTIEILKLKLLMGGGDNKADMDKLIVEMKAEREANKEDQKRLMELFTDKEEKNKWEKLMADRDKHQEERDAVFMEELRHLRTPAPEEPRNRIVAAAEELDAARKSLETVGAIKPATEDERKHELTLRAQASADTKETELIKFMDKRIGSAENSLNDKVDMVLSAFMNEQRIRGAQAGINLPGGQPPQPANPPQAPPAGTIPRDQLYQRMASVAAQGQPAEDEGEEEEEGAPQA